jgi:sulfonate transport system ATP-binding protein
MSIQSINARNQIRGRIEDILVDSVLSEVLIRTTSGIVSSTVLTRSLSEQPLEVGAEVLATFKSNEVVLAT